MWEPKFTEGQKPADIIEQSTQSATQAIRWNITALGNARGKPTASALMAAMAEDLGPLLDAMIEKQRKGVSDKQISAKRRV
jgi:hypothetical protein